MGFARVRYASLLLFSIEKRNSFFFFILNLIRFHRLINSLISADRLLYFNFIDIYLYMKINPVFLQLFYPRDLYNKTKNAVHYLYFFFPFLQHYLYINPILACHVKNQYKYITRRLLIPVPKQRSGYLINLCSCFSKEQAKKG